MPETIRQVRDPCQRGKVPIGVSQGEAGWPTVPAPGPPVETVCTVVPADDDLVSSTGTGTVCLHPELDGETAVYAPIEGIISGHGRHVNPCGATIELLPSVDVSRGLDRATASTFTIVSIVKIVVSRAAGFVQLPVGDHIGWAGLRFVQSDLGRIGVGHIVAYRRSARDDRAVDKAIGYIIHGTRVAPA